MSDKSKSEEIIDKDFAYYLQGYNRVPIVLESGSGTILKDLDGNEYIDCFAGISVSNVGHAPHRLASVAANQMRKLIHSSGRFHNIPQTLLVEKIAELSPGDLQYSFLCNSGAEAVENGVKLAKKHATQNNKTASGIIALEMSFHGRLGYSLSLTGQSKYKKGFSTYANAPGVVHAPVPYHYRSKLDMDEFGEITANKVDILIDQHTAGDVGAFVIEPILGEGGIIVPPDSYYKTLVSILKEREIPFFVDEVQTGFGRTGKMFASEYWGLKPDIFSLAKGLGGGMPIAATVTTPTIAKSIESGDFFSTYGGNPVCSAVALENINILQGDKLADNAIKIGKVFTDELEQLQNRFDLIGDVRGKGLMIGIELVKDRVSKTPATEATKKIVKDMQNNGVLMGLGGFYGNVLRLQPPLVITEDQANKVMTVMTQALQKLNN